MPTQVYALRTHPEDDLSSGIPPELDAPPQTGLLQHSEFTRRIMDAYSTDAWFTYPKNLAKVVKSGDMYLRGTAIAVPNDAEARRHCLYLAHDSPLSGHPGRSRTLQLLSRWFWWPRMAADVEAYVRQCHSCQTIKYSTRKPQGLLRPLPIPDGVWDVVTIDFITGLPETTSGNDQIIAYTDKLTKMVHFTATIKTITAPELAAIFCRDIVRLHGMPIRIVSDRDKLFTSTFWKSLSQLLGVHQAMSTAFHPQSDGQTERVNGILEDYLRAFVNETQNDWESYLWEAELAYNNAFHDTIRCTPFFLNSGREPRTPLSAAAESLAAKPPLPEAPEPDPATEPASTARVFVDDINDALTIAKRCAAAAQDRQAHYANTKRRPITLTVGQQVLLSTKNLRLKGEGMGKHLKRKLMPRFIGPFSITKEISDVAFELHLPDNMQCHPVFHVSLLRPYNTGPYALPPPNPLFFANGVEWEVDAIIDSTIVKFRKHKKLVTEEWFKVQWKGFGTPYNTWEPSSHMANAQEAIADWRLKQI